MDNFKPILEKLGGYIVDNLRANIKNKNYTGFGAFQASGKTADGLTYVVSDTSLQVMSTQGAILTLEVGRSAGKYPPYNPQSTTYGVKTRGKNKGKPRGDFPNISEWLDSKQSARSRFGFDGKTDAQKAGVVFTIARGLKEKGSTVKQKGGTDLISSVVTDEQILVILSEINALYIKEIKTVFDAA